MTSWWKNAGGENSAGCQEWTVTNVMRNRNGDTRAYGTQDSPVPLETFQSGEKVRLG